MPLKLWNVRTRTLEPFAPRTPGLVSMYVCGLTVYDHAHIGHARTAVGFEVIRRWLEHRATTEGWGKVRFVQNVTDVDDKIIDRAKQLGVSPKEHAANWDAECVAQMRRLGVRDPDEAPHVTTSIPGIIAFIQGILANGFAYATPQGNVYFDVPRYDAHAASAFKDGSGRGCAYGSLSNRDYREMAAGTRKDVETDKRHPADFALWKAGGEKGTHPDADWDSPWGKGRPGWHIECSLMATRSLGDRIDLHGGGQDLIFPHHENEVAQSQAKTGQAPFVNVWMHTGFLNVEGEKMSKSLGNFITLKDALDGLAAKGLDAEALRLYYLQTHYRSKIDYSEQGLHEAATALERLRRTRRNLAQAATARATSSTASAADAALAAAAKRLRAAFEASMDEDVHTPGALAALFEFQREANRAVDAAPGPSPRAARDALATLEWCAGTLTLLPPEASARSEGVPERLQDAARAALVPLDGATDEEAAMQVVIRARAHARATKQWARSDAIRDALKAAGYAIEDTPTGARWTRT